MLSNFMQTFYNLTDTFWLGKMAENATGAVSTAGIAFPLVWTLSSFGFGFAIAGTALVARYKGSDRPDKIKEVVGQFTLILIVFTTIFLFLSMFFLEYILHWLQIPKEILDMSRVYMRIIIAGMSFMFVFMFFQAISHGLGDTISPMKIQVVSVLTNVVLDPLLIFGIGFFPAMGVRGAALATFFSRFLAALFAVIYLAKYSKGLMPRLSDLKPKWKIIGNILKISIPASVGQSVTSFGFLILQGFVNSFGTVVISTFSIGNRMTGLFMMPAMGISNALATVVGQNLGAGKTERVKESVGKAFQLVYLILSFGCVILYFFGAELTKIFITEPAVVEVGSRMFKVTSLATFFFGVEFLFSGVFNGAGHTAATLRVNISRLWLFRIPLCYILSGRILDFDVIARSAIAPLLEKLAQPLSAFPYDALWWSMVISNIIAGLWAFIIYKKGKWRHIQFD
jgi:putative MATE family efflux protein